MKLVTRKMGAGPKDDLRSLASLFGVSEEDAVAVLARFALDRMDAEELSFYFGEYKKNPTGGRDDSPYPYRHQDLNLEVEPELAAAHAELRAERHFATHDHLTGLLNRRAAMKLLDEEPHSMVALCDVDGLKTVNDNHGHPAGDHLLQAIGARLAGAMSGVGTAFRLGGDEFLLVWNRLVRDDFRQLDLNPVTYVSDRVNAVLGRFVSHLSYRPQPDLRPVGERNEIILKPAISMGIATTESNPTTGNGRSLLSLADKAMYEAKASGKPVFVTLPK